FSRPFPKTECGGQLGASLLGCVDVALDFTHSDGTCGRRPVRMKDGVIGGLPPLMQEAVVRLTLIFHKAISIPVTITVYPVESSSQIGPERFYESAVAGPLVIRARQKDKQRGGVDTAVIAAEWHFLQRGHLAITCFVEDFPGFGVLFWNDFRGLGSGKKRQRAPGKARAQP